MKGTKELGDLARGFIGLANLLSERAMRDARGEHRGILNVGKIDIELMLIAETVARQGYELYKEAGIYATPCQKGGGWLTAATCDDLGCKGVFCEETCGLNSKEERDKRTEQAKEYARQLIMATFEK